MERSRVLLARDSKNLMARELVGYGQLRPRDARAALLWAMSKGTKIDLNPYSGGSLLSMTCRPGTDLCVRTWICAAKVLLGAWRFCSSLTSLGFLCFDCGIIEVCQVIPQVVHIHTASEPRARDSVLLTLTP